MVIDFLIFCGLYLLGFILNVVWVPQVLGSLFCEFPYLLKCYLNNEFNTVQPVLLPIITVVFWVLFIGFVNLIMYIFFKSAFFYLYTSLGFLLGILFSFILTFPQIGNAEMLAIREKNRNRFLIKD